MYGSVGSVVVMNSAIAAATLCGRRSSARIAAGDLAPVFAWLNANIWSQASRWDTPELVRRASGEALNPQHLRNHLETRYLGS